MLMEDNKLVVYDAVNDSFEDLFIPSEHGTTTDSELVEARFTLSDNEKLLVYIDNSTMAIIDMDSRKPIT